MDQQNEEHLKDVKSTQSVASGNSFTEFLTVTVRYRWFLFWFVFIITVSATAYALLAPKWYKSTTSVLPAENTDFLSAFSGLSSLVKNFSPSKGLAALTGNTEFDRYLAILKSSTMIDDVINKFELRKEYELEDSYREKVVKRFLSNVDMAVQDEGDLAVTIYDKDPQRAANIANYMISKLNEVNTRISVTNAKANREFIQKRYLQNVNDISDLETKMKDFQEKYGVVAVPEQIEATVKSMAAIYANLAQKEIAYNVLKRTYGENNPMSSRAEIEVQELQRKIKNLNTGTDSLQGGVQLLIPFKQAPDLANKYLKIYRDLEIQYKILEFVQPMYEQAKVEEARNMPSVLILDKAFPADRKSKPRGTIYALVSFVSSFVLGYFIVFIMVFFGKMKESEPQKYTFISSAIRKDLSRIGIRKKQG
jgi:uncharacterized protein involved in exopolysaccharide biosynthesis